MSYCVICRTVVHLGTIGVCVLLCVLQDGGTFKDHRSVCLTYCVLCRTVWASAGLASMEAVTREVSRDRYQMAEASDTDTSLLLVI